MVAKANSAAVVKVLLAACCFKVLLAGQVHWRGARNHPPETCDAIRNAATTAGRLISLRT